MSKRRKSKNSRSKGPCLFSDFGKKAQDLLTKGYSKDQILIISTNSGSGVKLTATAGKHGKFSRGGVAAQYKNTTVGVQVDAKPKISTSFTFVASEKFWPSMKTKASLRFPDYNLSKLSIQYFNEHATLAMSVALNWFPAVELSATIGTPSIAFGIEAKYKTTTCSFLYYNAGINVIKPNCNASIILANKGDLLRASYVQYVDQAKKTAGVVEITRRFSKNENSFTVGGSHAIDHLTMVQATFNYRGNLKALVQHKIKAKSYLTISAEVNMKKAFDKIPRIGLALALSL